MEQIILVKDVFGFWAEHMALVIGVGFELYSSYGAFLVKKDA